MGAIENAVGQLRSCTPDVCTFGGTTFQMAHNPLQTALSYFDVVMEEGMRCPPWLAEVRNFLITRMPKFRKNREVVLGHIDA